MFHIRVSLLGLLFILPLGSGIAHTEDSYNANDAFSDVSAGHLDLDREHWEFGIHFGLAKPIGKNHVTTTVQNSGFLESDPGDIGEDEFAENGLPSPDFTASSTLEGDLGQSYLVGAHLYYKVIPWVALGLDTSYSVAHSVSLDHPPAAFNSPIYDIRYKVSGAQLTAGGRFGGWIGDIRPWVMAGVGPYMLSQSVTAELNDPDDPDHPPVDMGAPPAVVYMSLLEGVGLDIRFRDTGSIGIGLQQQYVFVPGNHLQFLIPIARFDYHF